ncbi:predicted protein [Histoplasma capsulatum var. duboisii H88]|uniref:Predicted protein n=2 Tax=Ajellomyces capsulatus TaxID=5037 RepID=F0UT70_AJEC8|nr:predicted protein [Histoplasma capsulatum H143]EGC49097.1 predicted protein [Histoplasma capsulatum var. duboisii H88]
MTYSTRGSRAVKAAPVSGNPTRVSVSKFYAKLITLWVEDGSTSLQMVSHFNVWISVKSAFVHRTMCIELRIRGQNDRNSSPVAASSIQASDGDVSKSAKAVNGRGMRAEGDRSGKALLV